MLSAYIRALRENRALGVKETSSYGALQTLLDSAGATLKPSVRCILHPSSQGAGIPDGALFTRDQLQPLGREFDPKKALAMEPARGVIEVKGTGDDLQTLIASPQVEKYLARYRKVLCTNYREFAVVEQQGTQAHTLETFSFEPSEAAFWAATNDINGFVDKHEESFQAFLERALLYGAPLATPEAVASFMAACAREAKVRVERADVPALERVKSSLEAALNVSFGEQRADAFFRSSLVQTLFYGVFSAWVMWCRENPSDNGQRFDWRLSAYYLRVPVIQSLFYEFSNPQTVQSLNVIEPLEWVSDALNRVDREAFESRWSGATEDAIGSDSIGSAVQYFYEPFLEAFDPVLREQLGVWYTPAPIVRYMVERVDQVLKEELGIPDGLADENVVVLDPCCGTGAFLVGVIRHIHRALQERPQDALEANDLKGAVLNRVFGFELLTAPFVVAHLQIGLLLQSLGAPLGDSAERAQIFLTNALTGWHKPDGEQLKIELPGLQLEKQAAEKVKREEKILVILGNPPYSGYAGIAVGEERELSDAYRERINSKLPKPEGQGLNELYVRFFRMAERKITEETGRGVVCYISNYSWLDGKSHPAMREAYSNRFSKIWIDNLNGDRYRTGKKTPDGKPDPSIFSTPEDPVGIQVGTAISLLVKTPGATESERAQVHYRDLWGTAKIAQLEAETKGEITAEYAPLAPPVTLGLPFMPTQTSANYLTWPRLPELFPISFPGVQPSRDDAVVDVDRERLEARMTAYFDASKTDEEIRQIAPSAMTNTKRFDAQKTRKTLVERGFLPQNIIRYYYRPFDVRWLYWEPETKLLDEKRAEYWPHVFDGNLMMSAASTNRKKVDPSPISPLLCSRHTIDRGANIFPLYLRDTNADNLFADAGDTPHKTNLSDEARIYLSALDCDARTLFMHALAMQHAPRYRSDNADALRLDWPRIPLPADRETLETSGQLGETVAALLDVLESVPSVTTGALRPELGVLGLIQRIGGGHLKPDAGELKVTLNWGYRANGAVMPGSGKAVERAWTTVERAAIEAGAAALGLDLENALALLGGTAFDIYLNEFAFWSGVPSRVWNYTMGGYRVLKKWLSYRESDILGRDLSPSEAREATAIVRRIAALLLLEPQLDANYAACSTTTADWKHTQG